MAGVNQEVTLEEFARWCQEQGRDIEAIDWRPGLRLCAILLQSATKKNFEAAQSPDGAAWKPVEFRPEGYGGSNQPLNDFGLLKASASARGAQGHIEEVSSSVLTYGTALIYAAIHQFGGTIKPKKGRMLAIPLTREAARYKGPRDFPRQLFLWHGDPARPPLLCEEGKEKKLTPVYRLVPRVTIPARPFLGFNEPLVDQIQNVLAEAVVKRLNGQAGI
jgi:phage gpG-like protein